LDEDDELDYEESAIWQHVGAFKFSNDEPKVTAREYTAETFFTETKYPTEVGYHNIVAVPGAGKTTVFPEMLSKQTGKTSVVVLPNDVVLANVVANDDDVSYTTDKEYDKSTRLHYMTAKTFIDRVSDGDKPKEHCSVIIDEAQAQTVHTKLLVKTAETLALERPVYALHGHYGTDSFKIPNRVTQYEKRFFNKDNYKRVMVLHDNLALERKNIPPDELVVPSDVNQMIIFFRELRVKTRYVVHADAHRINGLNIDLDAVVAPDTIDKRAVEITEHLQFMNRVGRNNRSGYYFTDRIVRSSEVMRAIRGVDVNALRDKMLAVETKSASSGRKLRRFVVNKETMAASAFAIAQYEERIKLKQNKEVLKVEVLEIPVEKVIKTEPIVVTGEQLSNNDVDVKTYYSKQSIEEWIGYWYTEHDENREKVANTIFTMLLHNRNYLLFQTMLGKPVKGCTTYYELRDFVEKGRGAWLNEITEKCYYIMLEKRGVRLRTKVVRF